MATILDRIFGWFIQPQDKEPEPVSFAPRESDDGAATITATGAFGVFVDLDGTIRSEVELINRYRAMEQVGAVDKAIDEIANEVIVENDDNKCVPKIVLDDIDQPENVKTAVEDAYAEIIDLLDFENNGYSIYRRFYIDGRIYLHAIIDENNRKEGLIELRYVDPRKMRKIREVVKKPLKGSQNTSADATVQQTRNEYYVFSDKGFNLGTSRPLTTAYPISGIKIAKDAIVHITSGLTDAAQTMTLSHLHKAIKPLNMFSTLKDASVINRLARAPERRVWYINTGDMSPLKANQFVRDMMTKFRTKLSYDITSGEVQDDRRFLTMLDDFWIPVKSNGDGNKVELLQSSVNFSQIDDILFFQKELYASLHVPLNRISQDDMFNSPVATEITRDELTFGKFIDKQRRRFNKLFLDCLEKQLVLKEIMSLEDFKKIRKKINFLYSKDNHFVEAKDAQVLTVRYQLLQLIAPYVGRYVSNEWVRKTLLRQDDEEIEELDEQIQEESVNPQYEGIPGQPAMEEGQEGEGEGSDSEDGNAGVIVDPNAMKFPNPAEGEDKKENKANTAKPAGAKSAGQKKPPNFKKVSQILSRNK